MEEKKVYRAIGLMSGTSLDGVDVALIETDGYGHVKPIAYKEYPYDEALRAHVKSQFGKLEADQRAIDLITDAHIAAVKDLGHVADIIGFHGQSLHHDPDNGITVQIGDGERLARETGMNVVYDMRSADVAAGGQGAPLLPLYHEALVRSEGLDLPAMILNIGGISNITYIAEDGILAFDTGPGNALINDFVQSRTGAAYDKDGALAAAGTVNQNILKEALKHPFFARAVPKSLDRDAWDDLVKAIQPLSTEDGAATLTAFTVEAILKGMQHCPSPAKSWHVGGGGRHNKTLMDMLQEKLNAPIKPINALGWNGDALEAEGFAYLAVRSLLGEPLSLPTTTGVPKPTRGGVLAKV